MKLTKILAVALLTVSVNSFAGTPQEENYSMLGMVQSQLSDAFTLTEANEVCISTAMRDSFEKNGITEEKFNKELIDAKFFKKAGNAAVKSCKLK